MKRIDEIINSIAETYCQLGESGKQRTKPMIAGVAYKEAIKKELLWLLKDETLSTKPKSKAISIIRNDLRAELRKQIEELFK